MSTYSLYLMIGLC